MKTRIIGRTNRGAIAIHLAVALAGILLLTAILSSLHVSSSRSLLEQVLVYRLIDQAAASTFEEASALLEAQLNQIEFPAIGIHRRLNETLPWPASLDPAATREEFGPDGVEIGAVTLRTSPFLMFQAVEQDKSLLCVERGFLEMKVETKVKRGRFQVAREVTCRRIVFAEPGEGSHLTLKVQSANLLRVMRQK